MKRRKWRKTGFLATAESHHLGNIKTNIIIMREKIATASALIFYLINFEQR